MAIMAIFVILAIMAKLDMAINMGVMGVFLKRSQNADQTRKPFVNWSNGVKVMAKTKKFSDFMAISFVFWANISTGLWDPLGCSDLSQIFFGSSPTGIEWDKIVAEIIITTFVFLRHPKPCTSSYGVARLHVMAPIGLINFGRI